MLYRTSVHEQLMMGLDANVNHAWMYESLLSQLYSLALGYCTYYDNEMIEAIKEELIRLRNLGNDRCTLDEYRMCED